MIPIKDDKDMCPFYRGHTENLIHCEEFITNTKEAVKLRDKDAQGYTDVFCCGKQWDRCIRAQAHLYVNREALRK